RCPSALRGEGNLVEALAAEALGGTGDCAATEVAVEVHCGFVIREGPYDEAVETALHEVAARPHEQLSAKPQALEFRPQIKLVDFSVVIEAARAIAAVIGVARNVVAKHENGDPASIADRVFPPGRPPPVDELVEFRTGNYALVGGAPRLVVGSRNLRRIGRLGTTDLDKDRVHGSNSSKRQSGLQVCCL